MRAAEAGLRPSGRLENAAIAVLLVGSLVLPIFGWLAGIALVWLSDVWTNRDKLVATFVPPGGFFPAVYIAFGSGTTGDCTGGSTADGRVWEHCTGGPSALTQALWIAALAVLAIAPIVTAAYLSRQAKRRLRLAAA
jgi:hypothetical protein